jgi:predicted metal-dependent hydrolase
MMTPCVSRLTAAWFACAAVLGIGERPKKENMIRNRSSGPKAALLRRELLKIDGRAVEVSLRLNPRARRVIVKVHPTTGEVTVTAPSRRGLDHALEFARGEKEWIARQLARVPEPVALAPGSAIPFRGMTHRIRHGVSGTLPAWRDEVERAIFVRGRAEHAGRRLADFLKAEARRMFEIRALEFAARLGVKPARIAVRDTASRWGSCSSARSLSFSWRLILAPDFVLDYVVAHEVAHLREMNHGPRFWAHVKSLVGDPIAPQRWLRVNGRDLQRYSA